MKYFFFLLPSLVFAIANADAQTPTITSTLDGPRTPVFITPRDSCDPNDVPDAMARAFRDDKGTVHLIAASTDLYASTGPALDQVQHNCERAFKSANDGNPADYDDQVWIDSFYTLDGKKIAGLSHTEYHGWSFRGECNETQNLGACEYDPDTFHISTDGGYHFMQAKAPRSYVAGFPYEYRVDDGPMGYSVDSNIIAYDDWYYAIATDYQWPADCTGPTGLHHCVVPLGGSPIRTNNVFDPSSWRAWNGKDFDMSFVDPYLAPVQNPGQHIYTPLPYMQFANGLNVYQPANLAVATLWDYWDHELGPPGMYLTTSLDMVHWTKPKLVVKLKDILKLDPKGSWLYAYFSLIDPDASDRSFSIIGDHPYVYYVRLDNNGQGRVLFRQRLRLSLVQ